MQQRFDIEADKELANSDSSIGNDGIFWNSRDYQEDGEDKWKSGGHIHPLALYSWIALSNNILPE